MEWGVVSLTVTKEREDIKEIEGKNYLKYLLFYARALIKWIYEEPANFSP